MLDDAIRKVSAAPAPWDELRDRRILAALLAPRSPSPALPVVAVAAIFLVVVAVVAAIAWRRPGDEPRLAAPATSAPRALPVAESRLSLPDGSVALVSAGSDVRIAEGSPTAVRVLQATGSVRYDVRPAADRRFVVDAAGVRVEVVGTSFTVAVEDAGTRVHVLHGQVRVDDGARRIDLGTGEELLVAPAAATPAPAAQARIRRPTTSRSSSQGTPTPASFADQVARADEARGAGELAQAAEILRAAVAEHPSEPGLPTALFTLGRIERTLGRPAPAAEALRRCREAARGSLAEDALAEEAEALADAGDLEAARAAARLYSERYPRGTHRSRLTALTE